MNKIFPIIKISITRLREKTSMLLVFLILFGCCAFFIPNFLSLRNMVGLSLSVCTVGMVACTMMFCLASGDFDISVESTVAFAGVLAAIVINQTGSVMMGVLSALIAGSFAGLINGVIIARLKINPLITTLAIMQIVRGISLVISGGSAVGISQESFFVLGNQTFLGLPNPIWITIACFIVFGFLLNYTVFGRNTLAIGGNQEASLLAGIKVAKTKIIIFTMQGGIAALAGIVLAARMTSGQPNSSAGFSLDVISACVLGGVSLTGGVCTLLGTLIGVLIMGTVQNSMNLLNIPTFYQYIVRGVILLVAMLFDRLKHKTSI
jgi:L-arabinose transport system permease protein